MKEFIDFLKEIWKNKRTRSLAILILYFIFFVFVFMFINSNNSSYNYDSYSYLKSKQIIKMEFSGINDFVYENGKIYYNDMVYDQIPYELNLNLEIFSINNIYNLLKKSILESTNYVSKSNIYVLEYNDYNSIIDGNSQSSIRITIYENSKDIIEFDLTEINGYNVKIYLRS